MYRIGQEEKDAVARVIDSKELFKVNGGPLKETENCEREIREMFNVKRAVLMTSGTASLTSALIGMGIGPGDEVIIPAYTYIATALAVVSVGAMPVVAEIDETLMLDPNDIENKITERTKAVIPVHMMGYPCDMDRIMAIAKKHNLLVLEDACQGNGGKYKGKRLGSIGDAGALSFNYFKIISAGEGGALLTDNQDIFEKALIYHDSGAIAYFGDQMKGFSTEPFCGTEYRIGEITSAIMREQFKKLDGIVEDLRKNKALLIEEIGEAAEYIPSNDYDGDSGIALTIKFESEEECKLFAEKVNAIIPGYCGRHVYNDWKPILEKKGAFHPLLNPFNMEVNKNAKYSEDMCKKSLEILKKCAHISIDPDWTEAEIKETADKIKKAL
ncbi:MAG: DegT/DnrJ/EryC1/StrS family aminotransferase [Clostridia bacterium]|nr:DegT/DnrJ/EryC1/StrS family aminotransferase [Clostridia bacterium]